MIKRTLKQVQEMTKGSGLDNAFQDVFIEGVTIDSRNVTKGNLFIPIKGERFNGHTFAQEVIDNGVGAILWQKDEENPPQNIPIIYVDDTLLAIQQLATNYRDQLLVKIIGITGSNGKTSTKDILSSILSTTFSVHKTQGNYNNHLGVPLTILQINEKTEMAVLEMGMSGLGEIEILSKMAKPDAAIITNIGESHIQELGSRENISLAKMEIIAGLKDNGLFVYHGDEPLLIDKVNKLTNSYKLVTFGDSSTNNYIPKSIKVMDKAMHFTISQVDTTFELPVLGKHNILNSLAAIGVARNFGIPYDKIKIGLKNLKMTKMRMEIIKGEQGFTIINDAYNSSPTSVKAVLDLMYSLKGYEKKLVVLGDMLELGEQEVSYHKEIGAYVDPKEIDYLLTYGKLGKYIATGANINTKVKSYLDKQSLINDIKQIAKQNDIILIKASRGAKLEEVIEGLI